MMFGKVKVFHLKMNLRYMMHMMLHLYKWRKSRCSLYKSLLLNQHNNHQDNINYKNWNVRKQYYNLYNYLFQLQSMLNNLDHIIYMFLLKCLHINYLNNLQCIIFLYRMSSHYIFNKKCYHCRLNSLRYKNYKQFLFYRIHLDKLYNSLYYRTSIRNHMCYNFPFLQLCKWRILMSKYRISYLLHLKRYQLDNLQYNRLNN